MENLQKLWKQTDYPSMQMLGQTKKAKTETEKGNGKEGLNRRADKSKIVIQMTIYTDYAS